MSALLHGQTHPTRPRPPPGHLARRGIGTRRGNRGSSTRETARVTNTRLSAAAPLTLYVSGMCPAEVRDGRSFASHDDGRRDVVRVCRTMGDINAMVRATFDHAPLTRPIPRPVSGSLSLSKITQGGRPR